MDDCSPEIFDFVVSQLILEFDEQEFYIVPHSVNFLCFPAKSKKIFLYCIS